MVLRITIVLLFFACASSGRVDAQPNTGIGLNQIQVLYPGESDTLAPGIDLSPIQDMLKVELPPTVHVHRMYYSKTETIQGPIVHGGRHFVVARHPATNENNYVDVMLPRGTPQIRYEPRRIVYVYPDQHVIIGFCRTCFRGANTKVTYSKGPGVVASVAKFKHEVQEKVKFNVSRNRWINATKENGIEAKRALVGAVETFGRFGEELNDGIRAGVDNLPGLSSLKSQADDRLADREKSASQLSGLRSRINGTDFRLGTNR